MTDVPRAHLVLLRHTLLLDKRSAAEWRQLQDEYHDYKASLGPWTESEVVGHMEDDYGPDDSRWPFSRAGIAAFMREPRSTFLGATRP
jgi:hypothetical protein